MHLRIIFVYLLLLTGLCLPTLGQGRHVAESELGTLLKIAATLRNRLAYSVTESHYMLRDRNSTDEPWSTWTSEYSPPDRHRMIIWKGDKPGGVILSEKISIGSYVFKKRGSGEWEREAGHEKREAESVSVPPCGPSGKSSDSAGTLECEYLSSDVIDGESLELYRTTRTTTSKRSVGDAVEVMSTRYWFSSKGLLLKEEMEHGVVGSTRVQRVLTVYRYDPTIKIEAPIK